MTKDNPVQRTSGILLHPTSLPGPYGIGDLGPAAYKFIDFLVAAGQSLWQVLPLGPTGYGDSPYACYSAFAGNTLLVSPEKLITEGLLDSAPAASGSATKVDFGEAHKLKDQILRMLPPLSAAPPPVIADPSGQPTRALTCPNPVSEFFR